ncbi:MAG: MFS transporter [Bacteroidetes bacterium HGW-Bacteroidetes-17]|nr:MAG: MFS transporter [Bacteroidetes bacterium HGW-Bacteroidetes-17]
MHENKNYTAAFIIVTGLFFMWGFMTVLNDILIPYLKGVFDLNHTQAMFIQFAFFGAYFIGSLIYFIISVNYGDPISKIGYKNGIIVGLIISATGSALFYPAAHFLMYGFFLSALFVMGLGFTILQIAANPYVAILGSEKTASSRLNLSQGFNSLGTTIGPLIGGYLIFKYFVGGEINGADAVQVPYLFFTGIFILLAILIKLSDLPRLTKDETLEKGLSVLKHKHLIFGIIAIFMYVGGEVSIGSILISFLGLENIAGLDPSVASKFVAFYWGGLMIGRFMGAISMSKMKNMVLKYLSMLGIPVIAFLVILYFNDLRTAAIYSIFLLINFIGFLFGKSLPNRTLFVFAFISVMLLVTALLTNGVVAMWAVIGIGLFNSIMWSNIFTLAIAGLGKYTSQGSSLLVMAILGGALVPVFQGMMADAYGVHFSFVVPILCYLYIAFYGLKGYIQKVEKSI